MNNDSQERSVRFFGVSLIVHVLLAFAALTTVATKSLKPKELQGSSVDLLNHEAKNQIVAETAPAAASEIVNNPAPEATLTESKPAQEPSPSTISKDENPIVTVKPSALDIAVAPPKTKMKIEKPAAQLPSKKTKTAAKLATVLPAKKPTKKSTWQGVVPVVKELEEGSATEAIETDDASDTPDEEVFSDNSSTPSAEELTSKALSAQNAKQEDLEEEEESATTNAYTDPVEEDTKAIEQTTKEVKETLSPPPPAKQIENKAQTKRAQPQEERRALSNQIAQPNGLNSASGSSTRIRDESELTEARGNKMPEYPVKDRLARHQGTVVFVAQVNNDGSVRNIKLESSTSFSSLDESAFQAMKRWQFMPGQAGLVRKAFKFNLNGAVQELPARLRR